VGFNKRYITKESSLTALNDNKLKLYYGRADMMIFEDDLSEIIYDLYLSGKTEQEILNIINLNTEEKNSYEVH
jgi:hypothetical protein